MNLDRTIYEHCELCPRKCGADRTVSPGFCGMGAGAVLAKAMLHPWEEPAITDGTRPSGAVFFSGCTLKCVYCQNHKISSGGFGIGRTAQQIAQIFLDLQKHGACNIDLVTPTHFLPEVAEALQLAGPQLTIPVVYNTGGYERREVIRAVAPYITYWLPDVKYYSEELALRYSAAPGYFGIVCEALEEMIAAAEERALAEAATSEMAAEARTAKLAQESTAGEDSDAEARRAAKHRVIVRHLVLPGHRDDSIRLLRELAARFGTDRFLLSLLSQYTPPSDFAQTAAAPFPELRRRVMTYEYEKVLEEALRLGFDGYRQDRTTAKEEYTPDFDLSGLEGTDT